MGANCPRFAGLACPGRPCPGLADPGVCSHLERLAAWRALPAEAQVERFGVGRPAIDPAVRDAVNACPARGPVLAISLQDDCGCRGQELSSCRQGRGTTPGRVTLRDCLACRGG